MLTIPKNYSIETLTGALEQPSDSISGLFRLIGLDIASRSFGFTVSMRKAMSLCARENNC